MKIIFEPLVLRIHLLTNLHIRLLTNGSVFIYKTNNGRGNAFLLEMALQKMFGCCMRRGCSGSGRTFTKSNEEGQEILTIEDDDDPGIDLVAQ